MQKFEHSESEEIKRILEESERKEKFLDKIYTIFNDVAVSVFIILILYAALSRLF